MLIIVKTMESELLRTLITDFKSKDSKYYLYNELHPLEMGTKFNLIPSSEMIYNVCGGLDLSYLDVSLLEEWLKRYYIEDDMAFVQFMTPMMGYYYNNNCIILTRDGSYLVEIIMEALHL